MTETIPPPHSEQRSASHFNAATNLSERIPAAPNIISIRIGWLDFLGAQKYRYTIKAARRHELINRKLGGYGDFSRRKVGELGYWAKFSVLKYFAASDREKLQNLRNAKATTYLVIRGLPSMRRPDSFPFPDDSEFPEEQKQRDADYVQDIGDSARLEPPKEYAKRVRTALEYKRKEMDRRFWVVDYCIAGVAAGLGCEIRPRTDADDSPLAKHFLTDPSEQQTSDLDNIDLPLRFHQSAVERLLPTSADNISNSKSPACSFRVYYCVKNLLRVPIYLVRVKELIEDHLCKYESPERKKKIISILQTPNKFYRLPPQPNDGHSGLRDKDRVLTDWGTDGTSDWVMLYDHERVQAIDVEGEEALYELRSAIKRARRDAIRIDLKPTDILIVDNLRSMVSRREYLVTSFSDLLRLAISLPGNARTRTLANGVTITTKKWRRFYRPHRWLRVYYLFKTSDVEKERKPMSRGLLRVAKVLK